jgi:hypothetical protein
MVTHLLLNITDKGLKFLLKLSTNPGTSHNSRQVDRKDTLILQRLNKLSLAVIVRAWALKPLNVPLVLLWQQSCLRDPPKWQFSLHQGDRSTTKFIYVVFVRMWRGQLTTGLDLVRRDNTWKVVITPSNW